MSKRRVRLPVLPEQAGHTVEQQMGGGKPRAKKRPRYSAEVTRDRAVPVEAETELEIAELLAAFLLSGVPVGPLDALTVLLCWHDAHGRFVRWRAARTLVGTFEPFAGVPRTRADCPPDRGDVGCGHLACRHNLATSETPPGRPGLRNCPRDERGFTIPTHGELGPGADPAISPLWLQAGRMPDMCALDVADRGSIEDTATIGVTLGKHRTLVLRLFKRGLRNLQAKGVTVDDLLRLMEREPTNGNLSEMIETGITQRRRS